MSAGTRRFFGVGIVMVGVTVGCSFGGNASGGESNAIETSVGSTPAIAKPSATPVPDDAGGDGVPTFGDGPWTGGEAVVRVTGAENFTLSASLYETSVTQGGITHLVYADGADTINVDIDPGRDEVIATAYQEPIYTEINFDQPICEVVWLEASETAIEGTLRCENLEAHYGDNPGPVILEGEFTATR
jgi:hypothetical protein